MIGFRYFHSQNTLGIDLTLLLIYHFNRPLSKIVTKVDILGEAHCVRRPERTSDFELLG